MRLQEDLNKSNRKGISRKKLAKNKFKYVSSSNKIIKNATTINRIAKLRIPPAWKDVWISPVSGSKLQATGIDAKGRKQYLYHASFREKQERSKYFRILKFARALPKIRRVVRRDLNRKKLDKQKVLAAIVRLMEVTLIRIGNEEYAKSNKSYGLTTMKDRHVRIRGKNIEFHFMGKSKKEHEINIKDAKLVPIIRRCRALDGDDLFQFLDEKGNIHDVKASHVNDYIREACSDNFSAKDFRTWAGTVLAAIALSEYKQVDSQAATKKYIREAIESVAKNLGNTPTICRKCYIHPAILKEFNLNSGLGVIKKQLNQRLKRKLQDFSAEEGVVLAFLQKRLHANSH